MIDAAKVYCPGQCAPGIVQAVEEQGLVALVEDDTVWGIGCVEILIIPSWEAPEYEPGGQIEEQLIADIALQGAPPPTCTSGPQFCITAFACENLSAVEQAFEAAGIPAEDGLFPEGEFSGRVEIDTNY